MKTGGILKLSTFILLATHVAAGAIGFGAGIYALPILIAPTSPSVSEIEGMASQQDYTGHFKKDLKGSDSLHWGKGEVSIGPKFITLVGKLAPGPDYQLYLSPEFVDTEANFERLQTSMVRVGDVKTFDNFVVKVPPSINPSQYNTVIVWCETFGEFITSARYR